MAGDPYADSVRRVLAERAYGPIYSATYADAAKSARANEAARRLGIDPGLIEGDFDNMMAEDKLRRAYTDSIANPTYARMMSNPRFAAAAIDDDKLPDFATRVGEMRDLRSDKGFQGWAARLKGATALSSPVPQKASPTAVGVGLTLLQALTNPGALFGSVVTNKARESAGLVQQDINRYGRAGAVRRYAGDLAPSSIWGSLKAGSAEALAGIQGAGEFGAEALGFDEAADKAREGRRRLQVYADTVRPGTVTTFGRDVQSGVESVPSSVGAAGLSLLTANPAPGLALMGLTTFGQSYGEASDQGYGTGYSATKAGIDAAVEVGTERLPLMKLVGDVGGKATLRKLLLDQIATEVPGEQVATLLQDFNQWAMIDRNKGKSVEQYVDEILPHAWSTLVATAVTTGAVTAPMAAHRVYERIGRRAQDIAAKRDDKAELKFLDKMMEGAADIGSRTSNPSDFRDTLANELAGTEAENVYVPAEAIRSLYQGADELGDDPFWGRYVDEIAEADALGGDVVIPLADAATHLAGTPQWEQLKDHVRLSPGGSSKAEIADWEAEFDDANRAGGEQLAAMLAEELDRQEPVQRVHDEMRDKLMLAGFTPDVASNLATSYAQRQRVRAERKGEYLRGDEAHFVDVRQVLPPKLAAVKAGALPDKDLGAVIKEMKRGRGERSDKAKFGRNLIEWIQGQGGVEDPGGDLKSMGAAAMKGISRKGEKKLIRPTAQTGGMFGPSGQQNANTLDELALRAWEAGYFPELSERPTVNQMLEAIGEGLHDRHRYATDRTDEEDDVRMAAQELYALLDQQGIDPEKASAREIQKAVERYQSEQQDGGSAFTQNNEEAFRRWAGTDKIIEPDEANDFDFSGPGPFVMRAYHGTTHDFEAFDASVKGTKEGQFGAVNYFTTSLQDVEANYAGEGPDLTNRIERRAEAIESEHFAETGEEIDPAEAKQRARKEIAGEQPKTIEVFVRTEKPFVVGGERSPWLEFADFDKLEAEAIQRVADDEGVNVEDVQANRDDYEEQIDEARWEIEADTPNALFEAIQRVAERHENLDPQALFGEVADMSAEGASHSEFEKALRASENLSYVDDAETGDLIGYHLLGEIIEELGFDSIILKNAEQRFSNMKMDPGTVHIQIFDKHNTNIKSVNNTGSFDPADPRIMFQSLFDEPAQPNRSMTQAQRAELEARQKQSMARRGGQQAISDQEGGLFSAERDQRSLFQMAQRESDEFKAWFDGSKVVDAEGRPLVVYHGTNKSFDAFKPNSWFAATADLAAWFTQGRRGDATKSKGNNIVPAFLRIENPLDLRDVDIFSHKTPSEFAKLVGIPFEELDARTRELAQPAFDEMQDMDRAKKYMGPLGVVGWAIDPEASSKDQRADSLWRYFDNPRILQVLSERGFDGVRTKESMQLKEGKRPRALKSASGETWLAFDPTQIKSAIANRGTFDPNDPSILNQSFEDGARGRITFMTNKPSVIELFEKRDLSTFIHETGHLYLEELREDAASVGEGQLLDDWNTVVDWFKDNGFEIAPDGTIPTEAHEMFARGFERYTMEGKAPSSALRKAFEAFRSWLLSIYKVVDNLRAPITPEIRDVMARLMATDEEIDAARTEQQIKALFSTAAEAGMTEAEFAAYQTAATESRDEAFDALLYRTMAPIRAARTQQHKEREAAVRAEVMAEVDAQPLYRALRLIKSGEDGSAPMRLDRQWLVDTYGEEVLDALPRAVPPLHTDKNPTDADTLAERAGFSSSDQMVKMLIGHEDTRQQLRAGGDKRSPRQVAIDEATAETMASRYGDPLRDGSIEEEARAIIHNDKQGEVIASEVRALARRSGNKPTPYAIAKRWAKEKIASGQVNEVVSGNALQRYQRAARKAAKDAEAAMLDRNVDEAFRHKQAQMLNNALIAEGLKAKDAVDAAVRRLGKTARRKAAKSIDQGYLDQAHALLEQVEFRQRPQSQIDRQESFEEWAQAQRTAGVDIATPPGFAATIGQRNWSRLTVEEILGLDDTVKQILHLGRLKQTLLDGKERRDRDEVIAEMRATAQGIGKGPPTALNDPSRNFLSGAKSKLLGLDAAMIKIEQLVDWLDKGNPNGVFNRMLFKPLAEAQGREADMMRDYVSRINDAVKAMPKKQLKDWRRRVDTPELLNHVEGHPSEGQPWQFYKDQIVMIALNWGNEGNRQRLLDGYGWSEAQVSAVLDRLMTAEDWAFVQSTWDTVNGLWPEVEALEKRVNGFAPDKIEATPVETRFGTFNGGYFPAVYDPQYSSRTDDQQAETLLEQGFLRANVRSSATKARAAQVKRPILLTMDVITRHLGEVIHDITHREALTETWRLVSDERVQRTITNALGREYTALLKPWLKNIANDQARNANSNSHVIGFLRKLGYNVSIVGLGFRLTSVLTQAAGIPNIVAQIGERRVLEGWWRFLRNPVSAYKEVTAKSAEMRDRFSTMDRDIVEQARVHSKGRIEDIAGVGWFRKYAYHGILIADAMLSTAGWIGAYRQASAKGMSEEESIYFADKVIRTSQGSGGAKDQAAITREHEAVKLFLKFFSYFSALYNQQRDIGHRMRRITGAKDAGSVLHYTFWAIVMPPLIDAMIRGNGPPDDDGDDESSIVKWGEWAAQRIFFGNVASIPFVRDIGGAIDSGFGYKMTPVQNVGESMLRGWGNLAKALDGDDETEVSSRWIKQTLNAIGLIMGYPTGQFASAAQFGADVASGEQEPETAGQVYRGVTTGNMEPANQR